MRKITLTIILITLGMCLLAQTLPVVAVAPFDVVSGVSKADADAINRLFYNRLGNSQKVRLVDRSVVDRDLKEHSFQFVGGADQLFPNIDAAYGVMDELVNKLIIAMSGTTVSVSNTSGNYKIGDTGPAGGIIFYDKGSVSNGWRYLEAAPASSEFNAEWGAYEKNVTGTQTGIGTGKENTQIVVRYLNSIGESGKAAQRCVALNIGGKNDWFLPSKDELNLMYVNLHQKGLGDFGKGTNRTSYHNWGYWSSSQEDSSFSYAWNQYFYDGIQFSNYKDSTGRVRAVRAF